MIKRLYEVTCDYCHYGINHYTYKPDKEDLEDVGAVVVGNLCFCDENCKESYFNKV